MMELLNETCRLKHLGDSCYICKKTIYCNKIRQNGKFNIECFKELGE